MFSHVLYLDLFLLQIELFIVTVQLPALASEIMSRKWLLGCLTAGAPGPYSPVEFTAIDEFLEQVTRTSVMRHLVHVFGDWGEGVCTDLRGPSSLERGDGR